MAAHRTRVTEAGRWLLALVIPSSALAIGSLHTTTLIVMTVLAALACALLWIHPPRQIPRPAHWAIVAMLILAVGTALQCIPLPDAFVSTIAPSNGEVWSRVLSPLREPAPSWHPLTVAPLSTRVELLKAAFYVCVFLGALRVVLLEGGTSFLERVVVASASCVALASLAHAAVHAERVFGLYRPHDSYAYATGRLGPLLNSNHVAAYMNAGALMAMWMAVSTRRSMKRIVAIAAAALLAGTSFWAGSRGGMGSLLLGILLLAGFAIARKRVGRRSIEVGLVLFALLATGVLVGASSDMARAELQDADFGKLDMIRRFASLVRASPLFGMGRGGFEAIAPSVAEQRTYVRFIAVEDFAVQWAVEWGVPLAVAAALAFGAALRPRVLLESERPAAGAWAAIVAVVAHDLVDFHLEVPGVVVIVIVCIALVVGSRLSSRRSSTPSPGVLRIRLLAFASIAGASLVSMLAIPTIGHSLQDERDRAAMLVKDPSVSAKDARNELRGMMLAHPAEPYFPLAGAILAQSRNDGSIVPWVGRALERYPRFGRAHLVLARSFATRNRAQARLEYRLAYTYDRTLEDVALREGLALVGDKDSGLELVAEGNIGNPVLDRLVVALSDRLPSTAAQLDVVLRERDASGTGPLAREVNAAILDVRHKHPWCDGADCFGAGLAAANQLVAREPERCESHLLLARLRIAGGDPKRGLDDLANGLQKTSDRGKCLRAFVELAIDVGERRIVDEALERARQGGCGTRDECVALYAWLALVEEQRGNLVKAVAFYKRAAEVASDGDVYLQRAADTAVRAGLLGEAVDAYGKLAQRHPEEPRYRNQVTELRAKAHERVMPAFKP